MKTVLMLMFGFSIVLPSHAGFDGLWLRCLPEWNRASPVMLLEIDKVESKWLAEWGQPYSASGTAKRDRKGRLTLSGCSSFRGEISEGCDKENPPVFLTLPQELSTERARATDRRLKEGAWIKTSKSEWASLEKRCESFVKS